MPKKAIIQLDSLSNFFLFAITVSMLMFSNGFYLFLCLATFIILFFQIQRPYRTGVFTIILTQHILQIIASVIQANYLGNDINYRSPENSTAILLSLFGMVALFSPVIYIQNRLPKVSMADFKNSSTVLSTEKCMYFYIAAFFISSLVSSVAFLFSGVTQIIFSIMKIKWLFFLLFGFLCLVKNEKKNILFIFVTVEFLLGFFSYFSDYKTVIYYLLILSASFVITINFKHVAYSILLGTGLILFAIVWSSIKTDYRKFLNRGTGRQVVGVSRDDALNKLYDLTGNVRQNNIESGTIGLLDRLQYTYHFAKAIERVPAVIPYQEGNNWSQVLQYTTTPRFLNPNKPSVDNSVKASKYTGIQYAGASKGVSFSLGYFAECYIDFGYLGMMVPLLLIGLLYGRLYKYFILKSSPNLLFNYAVVGSFFMEFNLYEMDATILIGRLFASIVTYVFLVLFVFPLIYNSLKINTNKL